MNGLEDFPADDIRTRNEESVFMGCHAQWLTPESVNEPMPRLDENQHLMLTADIILDNREELFERLSIHASDRRAMTDGELILRAYTKWGTESPKYLLGDYAYMVWDRERRLLFGARDLMGNRTLYYCQQENCFAFCSTISPLLALPNRIKTLNETWFADFLAIPDMFDSFDLASTVYGGIRQLPPGHSFVLQRGQFNVNRYDTVIPDRETKFKSNSEYEEAFRYELNTAVKARLRTRHKIAVSLSGGLDSSSVASFAARMLKDHGKSLDAYSYIPVDDFTDWTGNGMLANETPFIRATSDFIGNINNRYMSFANSNALTEVGEWLDTLEMPYKFVENSFWIRGFYEQAARDGAGILLTGAKGNHSVSWGPAIGCYAYMLRKWKLLKLYRELRWYSRKKGVGRKQLMILIAKRAFGATTLDPRERTPVLSAIINPEFACKMRMVERLSPHRNSLNGSRLLNALDARIQHFENGAISNTFGNKAMKLSLRYRVWERDPTSDVRVVRFCLSVPMAQYVREGQDRSLIRRSMAGLLPDEIRLNHRVRGIQGADWVYRMRAHWAEVIDEVESMCKEPVFARYMNVDRIRKACGFVGKAPEAEQAFNGETRLIMQSLVIGRFLHRFQA
ncbi:asparagine synthase-related protein [Paenibacillus sp. GCM10023250]|uniref:asparagine synthase-related protein n=1 Tax=Paenibacillus sp. GCM10023250 TaxID=3252648 RepID=UPI00361BF05E